MEERLEFDLEPALAGIETIESALTAATQSFKVGLAEALDLLSTVAIGDVDASAVTAGIDEAVQAADLEPELTADASGVTTEIDAAVGAADADVPVTADASSVTPAIDEAVGAADAEVDVNAVVDSVTQEIEAAIADADTTVEVSADTEAATSEISALGGAADETAESTGNLTGALDSLGGVSQLAAGDVGGIAATLGAVNENASLVTGVVLSAAGAIGVLVDQALDSETAQDRFNRALGATAEQVANIEVRGFADDLETLAERAGSSDEKLKLAAARIADLGHSADASDESIAQTSERILLLGTRLAVTNPTLGDAGDIADRLTAALARGGRATGAYGIALSAAEIEARALAETNKASAAELDIYERAAAGAAIVTERLGSSLRTDIIEGSQGTQIQLRALREEFGNTLETFGEPLLDDLVAAIEQGQPLVLGLARTFGELGEAAIPLVVQALTAFAPVMGTTTDLLTLVLQVLQPVIALIDAIPDPLLQAAAAMALFNKVGDGLAITAFNLVGRAEGGLRGIPAALSAINPATAAVTLGVGLLAVAWQKHAKEQAESNARVREGAAAFADESKAIGDTLEMIAQKRIPKDQQDDIRRLGLSFQEMGDLARGGGEGLEEFIDTAERSGEISSSVADALRANGGDVRDLRVNYQQLGISQRDMNDSNLALVETFRSLSKETQQSARDTLEQLVNTDKLTEAQKETVNALLDSTSGNIDYVAALEDVRPTSEEAAAGADEFSGALGEQGETAEQTREKLQELFDATLGFVNSQIAAETAALRFSDSLAAVREKQDAVTVAIREHGRGSAEAASAQRDYEDAVRDARDAAVAQAEAQVRLAADTAKANGTTLSAEEGQRIFVESLRGAAAQADGPTRQAIENLLNTASGLEAFRQVQLQIDADTAAAERALESLRVKLANLDRGLVGVNVSGHFMAGGSQTGPAFIEVGEAGRELVFVEAGTTATVVPNGPTEDILRQLGSGGGAAIDYDALAQALAREVARLRPNEITVNEVAEDPRATAFAVSAALGDAANR